MNMNEYLWKSSDAASEMRLLVEGAITLYEEDALSLQSLARIISSPKRPQHLTPSERRCTTCGSI